MNSNLEIETMNQFSLKIADVLNGNRVLAQLLLPQLLSPPPSMPTPDQIIERLYQEAVREMQVTTSTHLSYIYISDKIIRQFLLINGRISKEKMSNTYKGIKTSYSSVFSILLSRKLLSCIENGNATSRENEWTRSSTATNIEEHLHINIFLFNK